MTVLYDATDMNASLPKPADKVWAMYDGPYCLNYVTRGKWYEVDDRGDYFTRKADHAGFNWERCGHIGDNWHRHVGPTPPDAKASIFPQSGEKPAIIDCKPIDIEVPQGTGRIVVTWDETSPNDWHPHDGSPKRPKDVGKRDTVEYKWAWLGESGQGVMPANQLDWEIITHYRITERAPKKEKRWFVCGLKDPDRDVSFLNERNAREYHANNGGKLFTAKLKEVKE